MGRIADTIAEMRRELPAGVTLVAVSKFHPAEAVAEAYAAGQRTFGESRVQELAAKVATLPADIDWHFIGHLQRNKVRQLVACRPALIESVDSEALLDLIDRESERAGIVTRVLLEAHVAAEDTKTGFDPEALRQYFADRQFENLRAVHLCGIMGMASNVDDLDRIRADFDSLASLMRDIKTLCPDLRGFDTLSMGMSDDYPLAIAAGSNMVRIGSRIFGSRNY